MHPADPVEAAARPDSRAERWLRSGAWIALLLVLLVAVVLTLTPAAPMRGLSEFHESLGRLVSRLTLGQTDVSVEEAEALANVLLFVPIGLLLRLALPRAWSSLLLAVAIAGSLGIEVVQYLLLPARTPSLVDVLTNGGGTAIGLVAGADAQRLVRCWSRRRRCRAGSRVASDRGGASPHRCTVGGWVGGAPTQPADQRKPARSDDRHTR